MTAPKVILKDQQDYDPDQISQKTGAIIQSLGLDVWGRTVFVKPSFVYPSKSPTVKGVITNLALLVGVLRALRDAGAKRLLVGESSVAGPSRVSFHSVGVPSGPRLHRAGRLRPRLGAKVVETDPLKLPPAPVDDRPLGKKACPIEPDLVRLFHGGIVDE